MMLVRGYTGHEHLAEVGLIQMNGHLYDPVLRSFLMRDNFIQQSENTQNYNRYAYVLNNPLMYYKDLIQILDNFGEFEFGKLTLISLRNTLPRELADYGVNKNEIERVISENGEAKLQFIKMVDELGTTFKSQIKGE